MKNRFNTYDIVCSVAELQKSVGMRVNQIYDIDNKTYLIRLHRGEEKCVLLLESGNRIHITQYDWPKNVAPSGFSMKLRKHLKNKRLECLRQLGVDRIIDLQFGSGEASYHIILELYDRGNVIITDYQFTILNVLRPHMEGDKIRFAVRETYPLDRAKQWCEPLTETQLTDIIGRSKPNDTLKKVLNPNVGKETFAVVYVKNRNYGGPLLDHVLSEVGLSGNRKVSNSTNDIQLIHKAILLADKMLIQAREASAKGYIIQKREERVDPETKEVGYLLTNQEYHPYLFNQHKDMPYQEFDSFDRAVDEFYSTLEAQKIDLKALQIEREAMKKLENVRKDHTKRLGDLEKLQVEDKYKAELIIRNVQICDQALLFVQTALANQMSWEGVETLIKTASMNNLECAQKISKLNLNKDSITLLLDDPYNELSSDHIELQLSLTAQANARRYFDQKRTAAKKQQKTLESTKEAMKNAERKTKQTLKEVQTIASISKARKTYWFEKFYWFITSDNYLVLGGRDQQQNELLVKRHLRPYDVYVHADLSGASSIIVKMKSQDEEPPPRTLTEAGQAAIAYSVSWDARVATNAWWVRGSQVSKSAPTGEYLTTGSFMIRGKKNYLPTQPLVMGFTFMFRLEESSIENHKGERSAIQCETETVEMLAEQEQSEQEQEVILSESDGEPDREQITPKESELIKQGDEGENSQNNEEDSDDTVSDSDEKFPDTHIKVDHYTGEVLIQNTSESRSDSISASELSFPTLPKANHKKAPKKEQMDSASSKENKNVIKRGQKSKLKRIKEKYGHQDEEDRLKALISLKPNGPAKVSKKEKKKGKNISKGKNTVKVSMPAPTLLHVDSDAELEQNEEPEDMPDVKTDEFSMLSQLTGKPLAEDEILFAVPVVAPYTTLLNYKYKVKLTPGTGKRGKAARTALDMFTKDKNCSQREKDLLKAVRDQDLARNFPGKVKLSAPHLHK